MQVPLVDLSTTLECLSFGNTVAANYQANIYQCLNSNFDRTLNYHEAQATADDG